MGPCTKSQDSHGGTQQRDAQKKFNIRYGQGRQGANGTKGITHTHRYRYVKPYFFDLVTILFL